MVLGGQATMDKTIRRFRDISVLQASTRRLSMTFSPWYVGAASQHVLRMRFVPEDEAKRFDRFLVTIHPTRRHFSPFPRASQT